jgi:peptide/nickel transport system substrate-binding protein
MFESLYTRDEGANPKPELAEGVDISADGMTYTFKLRGGVKFHNGKTLTSADAKACDGALRARSAARRT